MPRPDELQRRPFRPRPDAAPEAASAADPERAQPSKTRRKAEMQALQGLGEALVELDPRRFDELAAAVELPERLVEALREARTITAWGGRKRQLQFIGKLMRDVDPAPIRRRLDLWSHGHALEAAQEHAIERWRERLLAEPGALDALAALYPALDRPRLRALSVRARDERNRATPPHAYRELFRELKALVAASR